MSAPPIRPDHPYYRFGVTHDWIGCVYGVTYEAVLAVRGALQIPAAKTLEVVFHIQGHSRRWPEAFSADATAYHIRFFSLRVAQAITDAGLTGIEFHPIQMTLGKPGRWTERAGDCPGYVWGRVTGVLLVDPILDGRLVQLDPSGLYLQEELPIAKYPHRRVRPEQPYAADFCRMVPAGGQYVTISRRGAEVLDRLKLKDVTIGAFPDGTL